MANLCDYIEQYLKRLIDSAENGMVEIQRNELAGMFHCVPSQINYVLETRFNGERGYLVESRRGGGGFIRIIKLRLDEREQLTSLIREKLAGGISERVAVNLIDRLVDDGMITPREAMMMKAVVSREVIDVPLPQRDLIRANIMKAMLLAVIRYR